MIRRIAPPFAVAFVLAAVACGTTPPASERLDRAQAASTGESVTSITSASVSCQVSDESFNGGNPFLCGDDLFGADLGIPVYDGTNTWILFGDSTTTDQAGGLRWSWGPASDPVGYFAGATLSTACTGLSLVTLAGATQTACANNTTGSVFAPDVVVAPPGQAIGDFVFQGSAVLPPTWPSGETLPANAAIPGTDEAPSGAFYWAGSIYAFYTGAPRDGVVFSNMPLPYVSYLTQWTPATTVSYPLSASGSRQIVSMVDYNLGNDVNPGPPTPPPGWSTTPPLAGNFIQVSPVPSGDYLYLFGTGAYRFSEVSLARLPMTAFGSPLPSSLVNVSGFQVWTGSKWSSTVKDAGAIVSDTSYDVGELSVQYYSQGIWLMMYAPRASGQVVVRWAAAPTGPWSPETVVLDTTTAASQRKYCCSGAKQPTPTGNEFWGCSGQQFLECATQTGGAPVSGPYAPYLFPSISAVNGSVYQVSYMLSSFEPYGAVLMTYDIGLSPCPAQACGFDEEWSTSSCACECKCGSIDGFCHLCTTL